MMRHQTGRNTKYHGYALSKGCWKMSSAGGLKSIDRLARTLFPWETATASSGIASTIACFCGATITPLFPCFSIRHLSREHLYNHQPCGKPVGTRQMHAQCQPLHKRGNRRNGSSKNFTAPSLVTILSTDDEPRIRPNVYITEKRDIEYWDLLRNNRGQQEFKLWVSFLSHIGFRWKSEWGSIHIFELKGPEGEDYKILFHAPHGQNGGKIPHAQHEVFGLPDWRNTSTSLYQRRGPKFRN